MLVVMLGLLGLIFGSFLSASVWRLHDSEKKHTKSYFLLKDRSFCPNCKHTLGFLDLIPVVSWLMLGGKCRYCHKPISRLEPLIETATALLFIASFIFWPYGFNSEGKVLFVFWLVFLSGFIFLTIYDLRWQLLPNKIVVALIGIGVLQLLVKLLFFNGGYHVVVDALLGVVFIAGLFYVLFLFSAGKWIGGGDVKLGVALGLLVGGPAEALLVVFGASLLGSLIAVPLMSLKRLKRTSLIAFGPFLMASTSICYFFGPDIISWYKNLILLGH